MGRWSAPTPETRRRVGRRGLAWPALFLALVGAVGGVLMLRSAAVHRVGDTPRATRACRAGLVEVTNGPYVGGATQEEAHSLAIINTSSVACSLHGYVRLVVYGEHGRPLPLRFAHHPTGGWPMATVVPRSFAIAPRASGYVFVAQNACYTGYATISGHIAVTLPSDRRALALTLRRPIALCTGPSAQVGNVVAISPIEPSIAATQGPIP